jgi:hypothetical protein
MGEAKCTHNWQPPHSMATHHAALATLEKCPCSGFGFRRRTSAESLSSGGNRNGMCPNSRAVSRASSISRILGADGKEVSIATNLAGCVAATSH